MVSKRRSYPRVRARISVKIRTEDGRTSSTETIRNISLGGVFIAMESPLGFGTEVDLEFLLPQGSDVMHCRGFVVWSTEGSKAQEEPVAGVGVRLMDIGINDMRLLAEFVEEQIRR